MILRDYRPEDFDALCEIDRLCFEPGISYLPEEIADWLGLSGTFTIVAETEVRQAVSPAIGCNTGVPPVPSKMARERATGETPVLRAATPLAGFVLVRKTRARIGHIITIDVLEGHRRWALGCN